MPFDKAAREATLNMQRDILDTFDKNGNFIRRIREHKTMAYLTLEDGTIFKGEAFGAKLILWVRSYSIRA